MGASLANSWVVQLEVTWISSTLHPIPRSSLPHCMRTRVSSLRCHAAGPCLAPTSVRTPESHQPLRPTQLGAPNLIHYYHIWTYNPRVYSLFLFNLVLPNLIHYYHIWTYNPRFYSLFLFNLVLPTPNPACSGRFHGGWMKPTAWLVRRTPRRIPLPGPRPGCIPWRSYRPSDLPARAQMQGKDALPRLSCAPLCLSGRPSGTTASSPKAYTAPRSQPHPQAPPAAASLPWHLPRHRFLHATPQTHG